MHPHTMTVEMQNGIYCREGNMSIYNHTTAIILLGIYPEGKPLQYGNIQAQCS